MWFAYLLSFECVYIHTMVVEFAGWLFHGHSGLFVQSQRCRFQVGENGRPALFTESFYHGTLGGLPGRRKFLNLLSAFGCDCEFHTIAASASDGLHETVSLQRPEIPHECRALHTQPIAQFRHVPAVLA